MRHVYFLFLLSLVTSAAPSPTLAQTGSNLVSYQGYLESGGAPVSGTRDLTFRLYRGPSPSVVWTETHHDVQVVDGVFHVLLGSTSSLDGAFNDTGRYSGRTYLSVEVGGEELPKQPVTAVPYAQSLSGYLRVDPGPDPHFEPNVIGGKGVVENEATAVTISGGGGTESGGSSMINTVRSDGGTIGGGGSNEVGGTVAGFEADYGTIAGGRRNVVAGVGSVIGGGEDNHVMAARGTIGGGKGNVLGTGLGSPEYAEGATICGGDSNTVFTYAGYVGGGAQNRVYATYGSIGGGRLNEVKESYAMIPGGYGNTAEGVGSFAAGWKAYAANAGAFVWADQSSEDPFTSTAENQFLVRAAGGVGLGTSSPDGKLDIFDMVKVQTDDTDPGNRSMRLFFKESDDTPNYGFSIVYGGNNSWDHTFDGNTFHLQANRLHILRHSNSVLGQAAVTIARDNGRVGIGTEDPQRLLHVNGDAEIQGQAHLIGEAITSLVRPRTDDYYALGLATHRWHIVHSKEGVDQTSDGRYKENVETIPSALDDVMQLRPVTFTWKDHLDDGLKRGLIAQEVAEVLPEIVSGSEETIMGLNYSELVPLLIRAIQEQQAQIERLEARLE